MCSARWQSFSSSSASGETAHRYGECHYAGGRWPQRRRVIIKAEVVRHPGRDPKNNPRFVVTNLSASPRHLYEAIYCARGDVENRIKELHHGHEIDRTSCSRFLANQLRALLSAAAYVLYQELRLRAARTAFRRAQVSTLRQAAELTQRDPDGAFFLFRRQRRRRSAASFTRYCPNCSPRSACFSPNSTVASR